MFYYILRPIAKFTFLVFFKRIHISNAKNLPKDAPVIIAANHPTAFLEPCVLACFLDRPLHFLAKGVLFKKKWATRILNSLHVLPVYRLQDRGYKFVKQNYSTFDTCYDALGANKTIMILAEGTTIQGKFLNPIQKGTARIAFGTLDKYPDLEEVFVVPTSVTYDYPEQARSSVHIAFAEPIRVRNFTKYYAENANKGLRLLTNELRSGILQYMVQIDDRQDEVLLEQLLTLHRSSASRESRFSVSSDIAPLLEQKAISSHINTLPPTEKEVLTTDTASLINQLDQYDLTTDCYRSKAPNAFVSNNSFAQLLGIMARAINLPPILLAWKIVDNKVTSIEFRSSVFIALVLVLYLLYLLLLASFAKVAGVQLLYVALVPILGYLGMLQKERQQTTQEIDKFLMMDHNTREKLIKMKDNLFNNVTLP